MTIRQVLFGEHSLTKVAGLFKTRRDAERVAWELKQNAGLSDGQVNLVGASDGTALNSPTFSRKLEPEQAGIGRTLIRAHVISGLAGVGIGLLVYAGFVAARSNAILSTPGMSLVAMVFLGGLAGLLVGGLLSLRPDHYRVIAVVRRAIREEQWALVIHPVSDMQLDRSLKLLQARSYRVVRSV